MYRVRKAITAKTDAQKPHSVSAEIVFTPKDMLDFLKSIEELRGRKISFTELGDGACEFTIGDMAYSFAADVV